jgi:hypothetical protein
MKSVKQPTHNTATQLRIKECVSNRNVILYRQIDVVFLLFVNECGVKE